MSSCIISSPLEIVETKSSSESMPVIGVGGAASVAAAEARTRFMGRASGVSAEIFASAAFRFLVVGGILSVGNVGLGMLAADEPRRMDIGGCSKARRATVNRCCWYNRLFSIIW